MRRVLLRYWQVLTDGSWRRTLLRLATLGALGAGGGLLFAWVGLAPIAASSGHWPVTSWFLHFAMRNSVELRAMAMPAPPDLSDPALVMQGAGHYATACAACHGAPGQPAALTALQMTPPPPPLVDKVAEWRDRELFWIVRHGVKFTAMPAWSSPRRDDEVWAMVAFLRRLPALSAEAWRELALFPDDEQPAAALRVEQLAGTAGTLDPRARAALAGCARCHGFDGLGRGDAAFPRLAGQREAYLLATLRAYREGRRQSGFMQTQTAGLDATVLQQLATYYASQPAPARSQRLKGENQALIARGRALALEGDAARGIPACADCHGPARHARNARYPLLAGQPATYLERQLALFAEDRRGGTTYAHIMQAVAKRLTPAQREEVAAFYQSAEID